MPFAWTPEHIDTLRELWGKAHSVAEIANILGGGLSRSAVCGKAHRIGLSSPRPPRQSKKAKARSREKRLNDPPPTRTFVFRTDGVLRKPPSPLPKLDPSYVPPIGQRKSLMELTPAHCRYIYGEPGQSYFYCGGQVERGASYCLHHDRLCRPGAYSHRYREAAE